MAFFGNLGGKGRMFQKPQMQGSPYSFYSEQQTPQAPVQQQAAPVAQAPQAAPQAPMQQPFQPQMGFMPQPFAAMGQHPIPHAMQGQMPQQMMGRFGWRGPSMQPGQQNWQMPNWAQMPSWMRG